jgi:hypothetical protein
MQASVAAEAGSGEGNAASEEAAGSGSDSGVETDWEEMGPSLQDFDDWPDAPVMMCPDPADRQQVGCLAASELHEFRQLHQAMARACLLRHFVACSAHSHSCWQ